jgi:Phospholipase_D-nuclease N-terminal/Short C-terminal domain
MTLAVDYPLVDLFWTFLITFGLIVYFWLLITVFADLFRRQDVSGWGKAAWSVFVLVLPLVGALIYLISQGRGMGERSVQESQQATQENEQYIHSVVAPGYRGVDEIARGKELLDRGALSQDEFDQLKRRVLV